MIVVNRIVNLILFKIQVKNKTEFSFKLNYSSIGQPSSIMYGHGIQVSISNLSLWVILVSWNTD